MGMSTRRDATFETALRSSVRAFDVAVVAAVPLALVAIYGLPEATREALVLNYQSPTVLAMYTSHFVHFSGAHLLTNLLAYLLAVVPAYGYCVLADRRLDFVVTFGVVMLGFPFVLSALNVVFVRPSVGFGFSGVAMAFLGFVPVALAMFAGERLAPAVSIDHAPLLFFAGVETIAVLAVPESVVGAIAVAVAALGVAVYSVALWEAVGADGFRVAAGRVGDAEFAAAGVVLVLAFPFVAFPTRIAENGVVLNVYTHLLGYCFGFIVPYATLRFGALSPN